MKPEVSIIIRTYNEEKNIKNCLESVFKQRCKNFEVIIVDSESIDNTLKIASKFPIKIIKIKKEDFSFGKALNIGCLNAKGECCVSLSAHAFPANNLWLDYLIKPLKNKKIAGVYGREIPKQNCNPLEARKILGTFSDKEKIQTRDCFFSNVNSVFKKGLWEKLKFNEKITSTEDHYWASQTLKKGYKIYYEPKAKVYHSHNYSLSSLYKRTKRNAYNKYKIIENKKPLFICYKGFDNFFYSIPILSKSQTADLNKKLPNDGRFCFSSAGWTILEPVFSVKVITTVGYCSTRCISIYILSSFS